MSDLIAAMSVVDVTDAPPIGEVRSQGRVKRSKAGRAGRPAGPGRSDDDTTALATTLRVPHSHLSRTGAAMDAVLLRAGKPLTPEERNAVRDAEAGEMGGEYRKLRREWVRICKRLARDPSHEEFVKTLRRMAAADRRLQEGYWLGADLLKEGRRQLSNCG